MQVQPIPFGVTFSIALSKLEARTSLHVCSVLSHTTNSLSNTQWLILNYLCVKHTNVMFTYIYVLERELSFHNNVAKEMFERLYTNVVFFHTQVILFDTQMSCLHTYTSWKRRLLFIKTWQKDVRALIFSRAFENFNPTWIGWTYSISRVVWMRSWYAILGCLHTHVHALVSCHCRDSWMCSCIIYQYISICTYIYIHTTFWQMLWRVPTQLDYCIDEKRNISHYNIYV